MITDIEAETPRPKTVKGWWTSKEEKARMEMRERAKLRRMYVTVCFREWIRGVVLDCFGVDGRKLVYLKDRNIDKLEILFVIMLRAVRGSHNLPLVYEPDVCGRYRGSLGRTQLARSHEACCQFVP